MSSSDSSYGSPPSAQSQESIFGDTSGVSDDDLEPISSQSTPFQSARDFSPSNSEASYPSDSNPEIPTRSNKRQKTAADWRSRHEDEITLGASLDHLRSQDLGVHLYNAHKLHVRAVPFKQKKRRGGQAGFQTMDPPRGWAAWPLPAKDVPREREEALRQWHVSEDRQWTVLSQDQPKSSRQVLEEVVIAHAARKARERFQKREWEEKSDDYESVYCDSRDGVPEEERAPPTSRNYPEGDVPDNDADQNEPASSHLNGTSTSDSKGIIAPPLHKVEPPKGEFLVENARLVPGPLTDEEHITALLQRPARQVLSQLDALLAAMHYAKVKKPKTGRFYEHESDERKRCENAANAPDARTPDGSDAPPPDAPNPSATMDADNADKGESPVNIGRAFKHLRRPPLRDWSAVLGFAALAGWPASTVQRARARCEQLFEQRMDFVRSMGEGEEASSDEAETEDECQPEPQTLEDQRAEHIFPGKLDAAAIKDGVHVDWFLTPLSMPKGNIRSKDNPGKGKTREEHAMGPDWQGPARKPGWRFEGFYAKIKERKRLELVQAEEAELEKQAKERGSGAEEATTT
jgi:RNA polymerase I specific transcription initiation factor